MISKKKKSGDFDILSHPVIEHYERKIYEYKQLVEISKGLNSTLEYNTLIDSILLTCMGQMQLLKAGIFLKKGIGQDGFFLHRNYKGFEISHPSDYELQSDSRLVTYIKKQLRCYSLPELKAEIGKDDSLKALSRLNPWLIVPLISKGGINGIIILAERINHEDFDESEKEFLVNIASLAGIAIHNASLYEMATTDMMTTLKIHHFFQALLIEELERARNSGRPLSLIMADIDHFKNFNDTYGHQAGDRIIINVAHVIRESIRQIDTASRYGGEEFAIILPGTDSEEAMLVADRIRLGVEKEAIDYNGQKLNVTISLGVTEYDMNTDRESKEILSRADKALYQSKKNGRNLVTVL